MIAPYVRIVLRYVAGVIAGYGVLGNEQETAALLMDPLLVAGVVSALNEAWYLIARRQGWAK